MMAVQSYGVELVLDAPGLASDPVFGESMLEAFLEAAAPADAVVSQDFVSGRIDVDFWVDSGGSAEAAEAASGIAASALARFGSDLTITRMSVELVRECDEVAA